MNINWSKKITLEPYRALYDSDATINLIFGGRDSGKTYALPQILTNKAIKYPKARVMLIRKNLNTVKPSMYDAFTNFFEDSGLEAIQSNTKTPLEIKFINGSDFLGRGCDDPFKIKSTTNPSDAWIEEATDITEDDFDVILTTLRSQVAPVQIWLTFNPEVDKNGKSWIRERFFKDFTDKDFEEKIYNKEYNFDIDVSGSEEKIKVKCIHTTCDINPYSDKSRIAIYDSYREINVNKYNVWRLGKWGRKEIKSPFAWAFNTEMIKEWDLDYTMDIDISFDFNNAPCTATISQQDHNRTFKRFWREIRLGTTTNHANVYDVCERIRRLLPDGAYIRVTGDSSGRNDSAMVRGNADAFEIIRRELNVSSQRVWTPKKQPTHLDSYNEFNDALQLRDVTFDPSMKYLIEDLQQVEYRNKSILKKEAEAKGMGHLLDCARYDINTFFY